MAPGIPEVAMKYGITNPTIIALTLSIFLLSFAFGVNSRLPFLTVCNLRNFLFYILNNTALGPRPSF